MLELPVTIRIPLAEEMPHRDDIETLLARREKAVIEEGYKLTLNNNPKLNWHFHAEININNSRLWKLLMALAEDLPAQLYCEYSHVDDEPLSSDYLTKPELLQQLSPFERELVQDAHLHFSLVSNQTSALSEIAVTPCKYIRFTGSNIDAFRKHMSAFNLKEIPVLSFVDEHPYLTEPLRKFVPTARRSEDVIWSLNRVFGIDE